MQLCSNLHNLTKEHQLIHLLMYLTTTDIVPAYVVNALQYVVDSCTQSECLEREEALQKGGMCNASNASTVLELARSKET